MPAHNVPLRIDQGATFEDVYTWKSGETKETAVPVDLTGCTALGHIKEEIDGVEILLVLSTENGRVILGGVDGTITIRIVAADTAAINWTSAFYDLKVKFANGFIVRRMGGRVTVSPGVTDVEPA